MVLGRERLEVTPGFYPIFKQVKQERLLFKIVAEKINLKLDKKQFSILP
jgi:hypothetical protein|tara:strand:+ start:262925 stop:263071 length:147 start_codon:yes stop_codon:yes gene_type:complete